MLFASKVIDPSLNVIFSILKIFSVAVLLTKVVMPSADDMPNSADTSPIIAVSAPSPPIIVTVPTALSGPAAPGTSL